MATATPVRKQTVPSRLCDVLDLFISTSLMAKEYQKAMDHLMGQWGTCSVCYTTIALAEPVLWNGDGFVHAREIRSEDAVSWDEVILGRHKGSVAERQNRKAA